MCWSNWNAICAGGARPPVHQDEFLLDQLDLCETAVLHGLRRQVSRYRKEPRTVDALLNILGSPGHGCAGFAVECQKHL